MYLNKWHKYIVRHADTYTYPYVVFGIFCIITYPAYYFVWYFANPSGYENFWLRLIVVFLSVPLIFKNKWKKSIKPFLPVYFYAVVTYCFPFLFTFFLLKNNYSLPAIFNSLSILMLCILVLDLASLLIVLPLGVFLGFLMCYITSGFIPAPANKISLIIVHLSFFLNGAIFAKTKESLHQAKLKTMQNVGESIAHELRTPLRTISMSVDTIRKDVNQLMEQSSDKKWEQHLKEILLSLGDINEETNESFTFINMLLARVDESKIASMPQEKLSMKLCINDALKRYPYDLKEKELVHWNDNQDFEFIGNSLLIMHVIFNLLKNSFYYIKAARKGEIFITLDSSKKQDILYFKDTGLGISKKNLSKIFDRFYSNTPHGAGIGLTFCKNVMESCGGNITCESKEGEYTTFKLTFPVINNTGVRQ